VRMGYTHKVLEFSIRLAERSQVPAFTIVASPRRRGDGRDAYLVKESVGLSIRDARRMLIFLQRYFCCFNFSLRTKPI
jgi:hypothetical protein